MNVFFFSKKRTHLLMFIAAPYLFTQCIERFLAIYGRSTKRKAQLKEIDIIVPVDATEIKPSRFLRVVLLLLLKCLAESIKRTIRNPEPLLGNERINRFFRYIFCQCNAMQQNIYALWTDYLIESAKWHWRVRAQRGNISRSETNWNATTANQSGALEEYNVEERYKEKWIAEETR